MGKKIPTYGQMFHLIIVLQIHEKPSKNGGVKDPGLLNDFHDLESGGIGHAGAGDQLTHSLEEVVVDLISKLGHVSLLDAFGGGGTSAAGFPVMGGRD